jgi:hypothetical protein
MAIALARAARRPACTYCGEALEISEEHVDIVAQAATRRAGSDTDRKGKLPNVCPICQRRGLFEMDKLGTTVRCMYCGCPFTLVAPPQAGVPGPLGASLGSAGATPRSSAPDPSSAARVAAGLDRLAALPPGTERAARVSRRALEALARRYTHGHATEHEAHFASERVLTLAARSAQRATIASCALTPEEAAELVAKVTASGRESSVTAADVDGTVVRIATGSHSIWTTETDARVSTLAALGAVEAVLGSYAGGIASARAKQVDVKHYLRVELQRRPDGCALAFANEHQTGEVHPLESAQRQLAEQVPGDLDRHGLRFVALRAIWGVWLNGTHMIALAEAGLDAWLARLGLQDSLRDAGIRAVLLR